MALTATERISLVKKALGIGSDYQDEVLEFYIEEAMDFLVGAGVPLEVAESKKAVGAIILFINDTWNLSSGSVTYSDALKARVCQLAMIKEW